MILRAVPDAAWSACPGFTSLGFYVVEGTTFLRASEKRRVAVGVPVLDLAGCGFLSKMSTFTRSPGLPAGQGLVTRGLPVYHSSGPASRKLVEWVSDQDPSVRPDPPKTQLIDDRYALQTTNSLRGEPPVPAAGCKE